MVRRSVNQPADRQVSQTSRQPKQPRLRQPQAGYRPLTAPDPAHWRLDVDEDDDTCPSEGSEYCSHVVWRPSRIPMRDHAHPLVDTPTNPHHIPISHHQEQGLPPVYAYAGEMESGFVEWDGSWKSQRTGVREEADLVDQVNSDVWSASVEKPPSRSDDRTPAVQYHSSAPSHDQVKATPKGGPTHPVPTPKGGPTHPVPTPSGGPTHPVPTPSHLAERGTDTLGPPTEKTPEV